MSANLLIRDVLVADPENMMTGVRKDIVVADGRIAEIAASGTAKAAAGLSATPTAAISSTRKRSLSRYSCGLAESASSIPEKNKRQPSTALGTVRNKA